MIDESSPDEPKEEPDLVRFLQDWAELWRGELRAQANDPEGLAGGVELWRAAMTLWTDALGVSPAPVHHAPARDAAARNHASAPPDSARPDSAQGTETAAAASDARDAAIERLVGRVDELEARLARLESARRRRG